MQDIASKLRCNIAASYSEAMDSATPGQSQTLTPETSRYLLEKLMKLLPEKKAVLLRLRDPDRIKAVIPQAKDVIHEGVRHLAVPHQVEVAQVLKNLGVDVPSPIGYYYKWSGMYEPFAHQKQVAEFLTLHNRAFNLSDLGCVDADTEYLSPTGWKRISEYENGLVAQYCPETERMEFVLPTEFVKLPCQEMIRVKTEYGVDQLLSPEHRMVIRDRIRPEKHEVVQAAELFARQEAWVAGAPPVYPHNGKPGATPIGYSDCAIPATCYGGGGSGMPLTDAEIRVQVAVIADAHFPSDSGNRCVMRLKKERKKVRLRQLLHEAGIEWSEREQNTATAQGGTVFTFNAPLRKKIFDDDFWAATAEQMLVARDEVMYWGEADRAVTFASGKGYSFSSREKASADYVQYINIATGRVARLQERRRVRRGRLEVEFVVNVRVNGNRNLALKEAGDNKARRRSMTLEPSTDGFKYCFMVPSTFLVLRRNGCVFCTGNTGKTLATLWAYDYLRSRGVVNKAVVISPLSTLERTWGDELFNHFQHLDYAVLHGPKDKRLKMLDQDVNVYLINHDGIKVAGMVEAFKGRDDIDLVIVDEIAQVGRNAGTERFKALNTLINKQVPRRAWGLTGAPIPNQPTDAWAQCRLLVPEKVPPYFNRFKEQVMRQVSNFVWVAKDNALEVVQEVMQPAIRFHRDECIDLPPCMYETREAELTKPQKDAYKDMLTKLHAEIDSGQVTAANEAVKAQKLIQIACLSYNTPVLTSDGWVAIQDVTCKHMVWDGAGWVRQQGAMYMGDKKVVPCFNVHMTEDHKVLTRSGWKTAKEVNDEQARISGREGRRLDREPVRLPRHTVSSETAYNAAARKAVPISSPCGEGTVTPGDVVPVFDLINCGPRNRFVVMGEDRKSLIVHNCGVIYDGAGEHLTLDTKPRMDAVVEIIEQSASKAIVFAPFVGVIAPLCKYLEEHGYTTETIHGGVSKGERDRIFTAFQKAKDPKVLVAQPAAMSHGLTLTAASTIIWYAPIPNNDIFEQANARITRPGQKHSQLIVMIEGTPIERKYYSRLKDKQRVQGILLDMINNERSTA